MGCRGGAVVIRCGETFRLALELRDQDTDELIAMLPKARATVRVDASSAPLVTLSSDDGDITVNDPADGQGELVISSTATAALADDRTEAYLAIEFFDDGVSPEEVEAYPPEPVTIEPDWV